MRNKKAKIIRKLAKQEAVERGFPDVNYKATQHKRTIWMRDEKGGIVPQDVIRLEVYLGDCARSLYQRLKDKIKKEHA